MAKRSKKRSNTLDNLGLSNRRSVLMYTKMMKRRLLPARRRRTRRAMYQRKIYNSQKMHE
jgi:hypothetical protein